MDYQSSMAVLGNDMKSANEDMVEDAEEDFYGSSPFPTANANGSHAVSGAAYEPPTFNFPNVTPSSQKAQLKPNGTPAPSSVTTARAAEQVKAEEQRKAENNQRLAEQLRQKLMAKRQNTPNKGPSRPDTPAKTTPAPQQPTPTVQQDGILGEQHDSSSDAFDLEALLAEGKAAAEAKLKQNTIKVPDRNVSTINGADESTKQEEAEPVEKESFPAQSEALNNTVAQAEQPQCPTQLSDPYYNDLAIWLELTGYHDVEYRDSKLRTFKERKALEEEYARIAERLEKLKKDEQATIESLRATPALHVANIRPPPALPSLLPDLNSAKLTTPKNRQTAFLQATNGTKRAHSPEAVQSDKFIRREETTGIRIRGANEAHDSRPSVRPHDSPAPASLDRRISWPNARRRSPDGVNHAPERREQERDPSLQRRLSYYRPDGVPASATHAAVDRGDRYGSARETGRYDERGRVGYDTANRAASPSGRHGYQHYRGSAGLDLRKGGVRYFMIKSWNHENVKTAMRDSLWATQQKNEHLLTDAFKTSRHVLLLFSVNKSTAFQGYALMTSPPDPSLPKPPFCAKLNWGTSPAFTLRWLATTSVHFKHVGHLKNNFNLDDNGLPMAVLVGKDGQEITADAGSGVVWVMDEAEEVEGRGFGGPGMSAGGR